MSYFYVNHLFTVIQRSNMNVTDKYFFLLLVNSPNKNQKLSLLKSISPSQYKVLKDITFQIFNEIIFIDGKQLRKLRKHKTLIRKLGNRKVSGHILAKNYSIVIEIVQIGLEDNEISPEIYFSSKRRMGKNKSSSEKCKALTYSQKRKEYFTSSSSESSEQFSSEEICNEEKHLQTSSGDSASGEEFTEESREKEEESYEDSQAEGNITDQEDE